MFVGALPLWWRLALVVLRRDRRGDRQRRRGRGHLHHVSDVARHRGPRTAGKPHDDGRRSTKLSRVHAGLSTSSRRAPPVNSSRCSPRAYRHGRWRVLLFEGSPSPFGSSFRGSSARGPALRRSSRSSRVVSHTSTRPSRAAMGASSVSFSCPSTVATSGPAWASCCSPSWALPFHSRSTRFRGCATRSRIVINVIAALIFVIHGHLAIADVFALLVGTLIGGYFGALLILRLSPRSCAWWSSSSASITTIKLAI